MLEQYINGVKANLREMFFYLHTDSGLYRCDIRDVPEDTSQGVSAGIYSISIFPALFPPLQAHGVYREAAARHHPADRGAV